MEIQNNASKCFLGIKAESLIVGLAMPKYQLDQLVFADSDSNADNELGRIPFSRKYITYTDKVFWNIFLKLFSPKEIERIDAYLEPLSLYLRLSDKVVCIGQNSWFNNIDIFFKKEFINFKPQTWVKFKALEETKLDNEFADWCNNFSDLCFYNDRNFTSIYKEWISRKTPVSLFFSSFVDDWYSFFQTDEGMKLWRTVPALYKIKIDLNPTIEKVAEFIFNFIQPHFYFNEDKFAKEVSDYLINNKTQFSRSNSFSVVEEDNKILHLVVEKNNPIRSDKFWDFPRVNFSTTKSGLVHWSWITKLSEQQRSRIDKKIIVDLTDFIIDQHYFSGIVALVDHDFELLFLQKTQTLYDKQLEVKLIQNFQELRAKDNFWSTWYSLPFDLTAKEFTGPEINSSFIYSVEGEVSQRVSWSKSSTAQNPTNYLDFSLLSENKSYWMHYIFNITRILWSDLYNSKF